MSPNTKHKSLSEVHGSVAVDRTTWFRRLLAFSGPAYMVSVGYMDPGNWATDLQAGARYGYALIWVLLMSNLMAVLLQTLSARLGLVTGRDLAQACRDFYSPIVAWPLWILCEIAIVACDLAEVLGSAIGLHLLFRIPILTGVMITAADVFILLFLQQWGIRKMEAFILTLVATIGACFFVEMWLVKPALGEVVRGFQPSFLRGDPLYIAMGMLGATVMPHNLYLHSALVQSRIVKRDPEGLARACRYNFIDTFVALNAAFFVNAAILVLAAGAFHASGHQEVAQLEQAYSLLTPLLGTAMASIVFAVALLCSGQSSTITGTLAGQVVMEGFLRWRIQPWMRRLLSRALAIVPAALVIASKGDAAVDDLLVLSQVVLSLQLPFAIVPLIMFTSDRAKMGTLVNARWVMAISWAVAAVIIGLNTKLVVEQITGWLSAAGPGSMWVKLAAVPLALALGGLLVWMVIEPLITRRGAKPAKDERLPIPAVSEDQVLRGAYQRLGVALEVGPADQAVLDHMGTLVAASGAEVFLLHVATGSMSQFLGREARDREVRQDERYLQDIAARLRETGLRVTVCLGAGDPKSELVRLAHEHRLDLLVTGAHGHGWLGDLLFGATASEVRHRLAIPVVTIPMEPKSAGEA